MPDESAAHQLNALWAQLVVDTCVRLGVTHFFLAPGSRCTPLTLAIAHDRRVQVAQHFDERGLAFVCLGYGRAAGRPGVFVCTSGTAVANAFPAVIEASLEHVPMLLITADRPFELQDCGANQTIRQSGIFGSYTVWDTTLPAPTQDVALRAVQSVMADAVAQADDGPVHLNLPFREPLATRDQPVSLPPIGDPTRTRRAPARSDVELEGGRTLVIAGRCRPAESRAAQALALRLGVPFLADITSGLRGLPHDLVLMRPDVPPADTVIHVGGRIVSKRWYQWLDQRPARHVIHLTAHRQRIDPVQRVTERWQGPIPELCDALRLGQPSPPDYLAWWQQQSGLCRRAAERILAQSPAITEPRIASFVARYLPSDHGLFLGNSMPVRDMDTFGAWEEDRQIAVGANRGASGIDGNLASATGFSRGLGRPVTVILGDLALLHDLNSLELVGQLDLPLVLIVINNNGGGIFHFLPIAGQTRHFERFFATPHNRTFDRAAQMFQLEYARPEAMDQLERLYEAAVESRSSWLIEVQVDRYANARLHRSIEGSVRAA